MATDKQSGFWMEKVSRLQKKRHHSRLGVPIGAQSDYVKEFAMKGRNRQAYADGTYLGWNDKSDHLYECITDPTRLYTSRISRMNRPEADWSSL